MHPDPTDQALTLVDRVRNQHCSVCGTTLTFRQSSRGVCGSRTCQRTHAQRISRESQRRDAETQRRRESLFEQAALARDEMLSEQGDSPENYVVALVPSNELPLVPLPESRKQRFREHLRGVTEDAFRDWQPEPKQDGSRDPGTDPAGEEESTQAAARLAVLGEACAMCRGRCCQEGDTSAYLDVTTIRQYAEQNDVRSADKAFEDYVRYLPTFSYEESCVFHTQTGCALPREMRAEVSRSFFCEGLDAFQTALNRLETPRGLVAALFESKIKRYGLVGERADQTTDETAEGDEPDVAKKSEKLRNK